MPLFFLYVGKLQAYYANDSAILSKTKKIFEQLKTLIIYNISLCFSISLKRTTSLKIYIY